MLKCLKPKNNQSLNRILLVLIKKKECTQSYIIFVNNSVIWSSKIFILPNICIEGTFYRLYECD